MNEKFWKTLSTLVSDSEIHIDRPKGSVHPRFSDYVYPFDYGELTGTKSQDGAGIDIWVGSMGEDGGVTGIIVIVDGMKKDSEIKVLVGCTEEDAQTILPYQNRGQMAGKLIMKN